MTNRFDNARNATKALLEGLGHADITFPGLDKNGKVQVSFTHTECGTAQTWQLSNITKRLKADETIAPCSHCGARRRTANATLASAVAALARK
jgi:hypothetical protein